MSGTDTSWMNAVAIQTPPPGLMLNAAKPQTSAPSKASGDASWMDQVAIPTPPPGVQFKMQADKAQPSTWRGMARNAAAGLTDVGTNLVNTLSDAGGNLIGKPLATGLVFAHDAIAPMLGGQRFPDDVRQMLLDDNTPQPGTRVTNAIADTIGAQRPEDVPANGAMERLTRKVVGTAGSALSLAPVGAGVALPVAAGAGGALVGDQAAQAAPEWAQPVAELAGNVAGGVGTIGGIKGAQAVASPVAAAAGRMGIARPTWLGGEGKQDFGNVRATGAQLDQAANTLLQQIGPEGAAALQQSGAAEAQARALETKLLEPAITPAERVATQRELNALAPLREQSVPGLQPTTGQLAPQAAAYEQQMRNIHGPDFVARDQSNNGALSREIDAAAPDAASTGAVGALFLRGLDALEQQGQRAEATAQQGVESGVRAIGAPSDADTTGAAIRSGAVDAKAAQAQAESRLWNLLPDDLALPQSRISDAGKQMLEDYGKDYGGSLTEPEKRVFTAASQLPSVIPFDGLKTLRSVIGDAKRELAPGGNQQALRRLGIVEKAIDATIAETVEQAAKVDPGLQDRLSTMVGESTGGNQPIPRGDGGSGNPAMAEPGAAASGGRGGTDSAGTGGQGSSRSVGGLAAGEAVGRVAPLKGPNRAPETLHDLLISHGGVRDESGEFVDLANIHHRGGGRLINPKGMDQDRARMLARDYGFPVGDDLRSFRDAVIENRMLPEDVAQRSMDRRASTEAHQESEARYNSRDAIHTVLDQAEVHLSPREIDHAIELHMRGADPLDAVQQAARSTEEAVLQQNAQRQGMGRLGVPGGAEQTEMPVSRAQLTPNFTGEHAANYLAARRATLEKYQTFGQGPVGAILKPGPNGATFNTETAKVAKQFLTGDAAEPARVTKFIDAVGGNAKAVNAMRTALVTDLYDKRIVQPDGTLNAKKFDEWRAGRDRTIRQFPGLADGLETASAAQRALHATIARNVQDMRDYRRGVASHFLNGDEVIEPDRAIGKLLGSETRTRDARQIYAAIKDNPHALAGMQRMMVDDLVRRFGFQSDPEAVSSPRSKAFRDHMDRYREVYKPFFGGQGVQNIERVQAAMARAARINLPEATAGSPTSQKLQSAKAHGAFDHGVSPLFVLLGEHLAEKVSPHLPAAGIIGAGAALIGNKLLQSGIKTRADLGREMMLHPELARVLLQRVDTKNAMSAMQARKVSAALQAAVLADLSGHRTERKQ